MAFDQIPPEGETGTEKTLNLQKLIADLLHFQLDIQAALSYAHDSHTFDDIVDMVLTGRLHFYKASEEAFIIMEVQRYPQHNVYHCFLAGGDLEDILETHPVLELNAKKLDCIYTSVAGRRGWERVLKKRGWEYGLTIMYREVK
jgi:hypothetical protein